MRPDFEDNATGMSESSSETQEQLTEMRKVGSGSSMRNGQPVDPKKNLLETPGNLRETTYYRMYSS